MREKLTTVVVLSVSLGAQVDCGQASTFDERGARWRVTYSIETHGFHVPTGIRDDLVAAGTGSFVFSQDGLTVESTMSEQGTLTTSQFTTCTGSWNLNLSGDHCIGMSLSSTSTPLPSDTWIIRTTHGSGLGCDALVARPGLRAQIPAGTCQGQPFFVDAGAIEMRMQFKPCAVGPTQFRGIGDTGTFVSEVRNIGNGALEVVSTRSVDSTSPDGSFRHELTTVRLEKSTGCACGVGPLHAPTFWESSFPSPTPGLAQHFEDAADPLTCAGLVDLEHLDSRLRVAVGELQGLVESVPGVRLIVTSAFRPRAYQRHLQEIHDNYLALLDAFPHAIRESANGGRPHLDVVGAAAQPCACVVDEINREIEKHCLVAGNNRHAPQVNPAGASLHEIGRAVDITIEGWPFTQHFLDDVAFMVGLHRPCGGRDRLIHYQLLADRHCIR